MRPIVRFGLFVSIVVGALVAVLMAVQSRAQTTPPAASAAASGATLDGGPEDQARVRRTARPRPAASRTARERPASSRVGNLPRYGIPVASGAGKTGFVSTNVRRPRGRTATGTTADPASLESAIPASTSVQPAQRARPAPPAQATARPQRPVRPGSVIEPPPPSVAGEIATLPRRRPPPDEDPYEPLGIRAGAFVLKPSIETTTGYDTNPGRSAGGRGSWFSVVAPEFHARSDWQRHELSADMRGTYSTYYSQHELDRPTFDGKINGRVDVTRDTNIDLEARGIIGTDNPGSPNLQAGLAKLPIFSTVGGTAGVRQRFNRLEVALKGTFDRTEYDNSLLTDGTTVSNKDRNFNQYGGTLRGSYELTPGVKPFVEVSADTRVHDLEFDSFGIQRDSKGFTGKVGTTLEIGRKLTGEIAVGYLTRTYQDPNLPTLRGAIFDASLVWAATPLTNVKLSARTSAGESTQPGVAGSLTRDVDVTVEHAFRRWLIGSVKLGYGNDDYIGSGRVDRRYSATAALTYKLTRSVQIKGEFRQEWLKSNIQGNDYTASVALVGLRLQR